MDNTISSIEEWRDVKDYEGRYKVSNLGNIKSLNYRRQKIEKILCLTMGKRGYLTITFGGKTKKKTLYAHGMVSRAFMGETPEGMVCDHIDGNRSNNNVNNLQYVTQRENVIKGKMCEGRKNLGLQEYLLTENKGILGYTTRKKMLVKLIRRLN